MGWDLFSQYVRALKESKAKWFLYENNASMSNEIKQCITNELGCEPILIDSADFSAQHRERLYWTNIPVIDWKKNSIVFEDIVDNETPYKYRDFTKYADTVKISKDGLKIRFDTSGKGHYGQANRARKTNQKWNTLTASGQDKNDIWVDKCISRHITPIEAERLQTLPDNYTACLNSEVKRCEVCGNGWTVDVIAHIFSGLANGKN
jgi:DNA (cytosine-5)-methyltransferase 3A